MCEVLMRDTSWSRVKQAAREHERHQHQVSKVTTVDALRHFALAAKEQLEATGKPWMGDKKIWLELTSLKIDLDPTENATVKGKQHPLMVASQLVCIPDSGMRVHTFTSPFTEKTHSFGPVAMCRLLRCSLVQEPLGH
jgi:hypothetical protein